MNARTTAMSNHRLGELGAKVVPAAGIIGLAGIAIAAAFGLLDLGGAKAYFWRSYLMAFMVACSICLGALFFVILQHCVKAGWSVTIRRLAEGVASNLLWLWIAFIPVVIGMKWGHLYEWANLEEVAHDEVLRHKIGYFFFGNPISHDAAGNAVVSDALPWFWILRAAFYFLLWGLLTRFFVGNSVRQDASGDINITYRMQKWAPISIGLLFITQAFASIDWIMSLEPHWFSTMFGVYFFAASSCGFYATLIVLMYLVQRSGRLTNEITPEHYQDAGKLLFAFGVVFWAYIAFSQYMLIWYANIPEETPWYMVRQMGGWGKFSLMLLFGHFALAFLLLISRHPKRVPHMVAALAGWMILMHIVDIYWLVMPHVPTEMVHAAKSYAQLAEQVTPADVGYHPSIMDLASIVGMLGLVAAGTALRLSGCSLLPERDPRLHESLAFENI
jgi:hypothetical protein